MKRIMPILFLLMLLCGCNREQAPATTGETTAAPTEAVAVDTYVPGSEVEQATDSALWQYDLGEPIAWITPFDGGVLAATGETLTTLSGETGTVSAQTNLTVKLDSAGYQTIPGGFIYYDGGKNQMVFLDAGLQEIKHLQLPDDISGAPAIAQNGKEIYYCAGQTVYALDTTQKTVRPVRTNTCLTQTLLGCCLDGSVIICKKQDMAQQWSTIYISADDGRLLQEDNGVQKIYSTTDTYFALRMDGTVSQYIYGKTTDSSLPVQLNIGSHSAFGALEQGGIIGQTETDDGVFLSFYNMKKTAAVKLPKEYKITQVSADGDGAVWLLTEKGSLLRWNLEKSAVTDDADYTGTVYTAQAPDTDGLKQCADRGDDIGKKYGVVVRVWERALVSNDAYDIEVEYQPEAINKTLDALEKELAKFPDKFLYKSVAGQIRVCIVRSIDGEVTSAYHWNDGDPFIVLSAGVNVEHAFMEAFSHVLDIHVLGNSSMTDNWASLNPKGFTYGMETTVMAYLEGENRAFTDRHAMESVTDDRASVFYYAMQKDNAEMFKSEIMQAKLLMLCKAIRDAWRLEKKTQTYLWEQYLNQSIAYQE